MSGKGPVEPLGDSTHTARIALMAEQFASGRIVVLVLPEVNLLDLSGPVQVFDAATHRGAGYGTEFVSESPDVVSAQGLRLAALAPLPEVVAGDLVLVPGPRLSRRADPAPLISAAASDWLRTAHGRGARIASVCTGAAALGDAGLLDGRRCTTHWSLVDAMRLRYPAARVSDGVLYVHDGSISTSAGIASGIDLALSLLERDRGPALTAAVARDLVVYLRRDPSSAQLSPFVEHRAHLDTAVHQIQDHLAQHLDAPHTLAELARLVHLSPRGLTRAFDRATGLSPLEYQQRLRLEQARTLLTETDLSVRKVAARCGFADERHLRRLFRVRLGQSPSQLRRSTASA